MGVEHRNVWVRFISWIDRDIPWLQSQQLLGFAPLAIAVFVAPGSLAMFIALGFYLVVTGICIWRLGLFAKRRWRVDRLIQKGMIRRFRRGDWIPVIKRKK